MTTVSGLKARSIASRKVAPKCRWGSLANRRQDYFRAFCRGPMDSAHMRPAGSSLTMLF